MSSHTFDVNTRPAPDRELVAIADYVADYRIDSETAYDTARYCLIDSLGCAFLALRYPECVRHLGPIVPGTVVPNGARVPGTAFELDPIKAAFDIGTLIRWLDFNDTWLAAEWGHPSDNLGAILACADHLSRQRMTKSQPPLLMGDVLSYAIKAHEIQGVLALENSFNRVGIDHVVLVKIASTAVATHLLGGTKAQIVDALSQAFVDGQALRTYRHAPNAGPRKSWAAGDATSRAVRLALLTLSGEAGCPSALTAKTWGLYDVLFQGKPFTFQRPYRSYVMENILFKISFPAEFHAQTAVECAVRLHRLVKDRLADVERIVLTTHESAIRIISKTGSLYNYADRDHCLQYMVAIALIHGTLNADHYHDAAASDPRLDRLRATMEVIEEPRYSREYLDPDKRSIANAVQVHFKNGSSTPKVEVEYPIGHRRRRQEGMPLLIEKFRSNLSGLMPASRVQQVLELCQDRERLAATPVPKFMEMLIET